MHHTIPKLEMAISRYQTSVWDEPKNRFKNHPWQTNYAGFSFVHLTHKTSYDQWLKMVRGLLFGKPQNQKQMSDFSKHQCRQTNNAQCTTLLEGRVSQVWACPDAPGWFYCRGKTGPSTDSFKIEYPKTACLDMTSGPQHSFFAPLLPASLHQEEVFLRRPTWKIEVYSNFIYCLHKEKKVYASFMCGLCIAFTKFTVANVTHGNLQPSAKSKRQSIIAQLQSFRMDLPFLLGYHSRRFSPGHGTAAAPCWHAPVPAGIQCHVESGAGPLKEWGRRDRCSAASNEGWLWPAAGDKDWGWSFSADQVFKFRWSAAGDQDWLFSVAGVRDCWPAAANDQGWFK